jgi:hypothetical protein
MIFEIIFKKMNKLFSIKMIEFQLFMKTKKIFEMKTIIIINKH